MINKIAVNSFVYVFGHMASISVIESQNFQFLYQMNLISWWEEDWVPTCKYISMLISSFSAHTVLCELIQDNPRVFHVWTPLANIVKVEFKLQRFKKKKTLSYTLKFLKIVWVLLSRKWKRRWIKGSLRDKWMKSSVLERALVSQERRWAIPLKITLSCFPS